MAKVLIPSLMRDLTDGRDHVEVDGRTVGELAAALESAHPGIRSRLCVGDRLDPAIILVVDGKVAARGLRHPVGPESKVLILPAVSGG